MHSAAAADARGRPPVQPLRNLPAVLKRAVPQVYTSCCVCAGYCNSVSVLLGSSSCFLKHLGPQALGRLVAETVGMFGIYSTMTSPHNPLLSTPPGPFWCINNCFQMRGWHRIQRIRNVSARVRYAFQYTPMQGKKPGERHYGKGKGSGLDRAVNGARKIDLPEDSRRRRTVASQVKSLTTDRITSRTIKGGAPQLKMF